MHLTTDPRTRQVLAGAAAGIVLTALVAAGGCGTTDRDDSSFNGDAVSVGPPIGPSTSTSTSGGTGGAAVVGDDGVPQPPQPDTDGPDPQPPDDGDGNGNGDGNGDGGGDGEPTMPDGCQDVLDAGGVLLMGPSPINLPSGVLGGEVTFANCTDAALPWSAATMPGVGLDPGDGELAPYAGEALGFMIDAAAHEPGALEFTITVSAADVDHGVDVTAFREPNGFDFVGDFGIAGGPGEGCDVQCVLTATIRASAQTADVDLSVETTVPAMLNVYVSTDEPIDEDGHPAFTDGALKAFSNGFVETFDASIGSLEPATRYHLILEATDEQGRSWYGTTSFRTITPFEPGGDHQAPDGPGGCSSECITTATVEPHGDGVALHVETHTPALIKAWFSTSPFPLDDDDQYPVLTGLDPIATAGDLDVSVWDTVIDGLEYSTEYHVALRAIDVNGGTSYFVGSFETPESAAMTVRFHTVGVLSDADDGGNPGELSFYWGALPDTLVGSLSEAQVSSGTTVTLGGDSLSIVDSGGFLPVLSVTAIEYDDPGITESCLWAETVWDEDATLEDCGYKVNAATSGIYDADALDAQPRCSEFGLDELADQPCMMLESADVGGDHPVIRALVSFEYDL